MTRRRRAAGRRRLHPLRARRLGRRREGPGRAGRPRRARGQPLQPARGRRPRCRPPATPTSSPSATAPSSSCPARSARCRRAPRPRTSRRATCCARSAAASAAASCCPSSTATSARWCRWASTRTVGNLMGFIVGKSMFIEGWFARLMYRSLYKMHQRALHGPIKVLLDTLRPHDHPPDRAARQAALASSRPEADRRKGELAGAKGPWPPRGLPRQFAFRRHPVHLHHLVAVVVDHLDRDPARSPASGTAATRSR